MKADSILINSGDLFRLVFVNVLFSCLITIHELYWVNLYTPTFKCCRVWLVLKGKASSIFRDEM